jgi:hypothetical protein
MRIAALVVTVVACTGNSGSTGAPDAPHGPGDAAATSDASGTVEDLDMTATDFECVLHWPQVGAYRITNKLGHDAATIAQNPNGGVMPVGTIVQIVPTEAMVKRRAGFSASTNDWEFFSLSVAASGTTISKRGTSDVVNQFNGNCHDCHAKAQPQYDFICGTTHGCDPLPLSESTLVSLQNSDPRCP